MKADLSKFWSLFNIPEPVEEYQFCQDRRWRFDYAWPDLKIAVEVEGGIWFGGRHNRPVGYQKDLEKYNRATLDGWKVFRFTPTQFRDGTAADFLEELFGLVYWKFELNCDCGNHLNATVLRRAYRFICSHCGREYSGIFK